MGRELTRADLVLCPSDFVMDTMVAHGVPASKCFISPFGVNTAVFTPRSEPPSMPRFVCVGGVGLRKGHQYLFQAFALLRRQLPKAELICVGPYKEDFRLERRKGEGTFEYYPYLTHPELAKLLHTCSGFVLASVEEGFARVLVEAMASGLPIIATYETGARTIVRDGIEGFIVPARDPEALARAMLKLAKEPTACQRMGRAAYEKIAGKNDWQAFADRLLAEFSLRWAGRNKNVSFSSSGQLRSGLAN
jgi:glycosyltransferase involved in cell wall biosynthesis